MASKDSVRKLALERIWRLFDVADEWAEKDPVVAKRCVQLAKKIRERFRVRFPNELKTRYCKKCSAYLKEKANARFNYRPNIVEIECMACGAKFLRKNVKP